MDVPFAHDTPAMFSANFFEDFDRSAKEVTLPVSDPIKSKETFAAVHYTTVGQLKPSLNKLASGHGQPQREVNG